MDRRAKLKTRILNRFRKRIKGQLVYKVNDNTKLIIEYMYGGKFCLKRKTRNNRKVSMQVVTLVADIDAIVGLVMKEKTRAIFGGIGKLPRK